MRTPEAGSVNDCCVVPHGEKKGEDIERTIGKVPPHGGHLGGDADVLGEEIRLNLTLQDPVKRSSSSCLTREGHRVVEASSNRRRGNLLPQSCRWQRDTWHSGCN